MPLLTTNPLFGVGCWVEGVFLPLWLPLCSLWAMFPPCGGLCWLLGVSLGCGGWGLFFWLRRARDCEGASRVPSPSNTFTCPPVSCPHGYAGRNNVPRFPLVAYWDMVGVGRACATACRKFVPRFRVLSDAGGGVFSCWWLVVAYRRGCRCWRLAACSCWRAGDSWCACAGC